MNKHWCALDKVGVWEREKENQRVQLSKSAAFQELSTMVPEGKRNAFRRQILQLSDQPVIISNKDYRANRIIIIHTSQDINPLRKGMAKSQQLFAILLQPHHLATQSTLWHQRQQNRKTEKFCAFPWGHPMGQWQT